MSSLASLKNRVTPVFDEIWELSPECFKPEAYDKLKDLTQQLINIYDADGRLEEFPFQPTSSRTISLPVSLLRPLLKGSICLVTGGLGCVGSSLIKKLLEFEVGKIIAIDTQTGKDRRFGDDDRVVIIEADICLPGLLEPVFEYYHPQYVFHTAAQRDPGYAEKDVLHTIQTNVIGSLNVARACEATNSVQQCVFSSTGKASRYYTTEVYAATKKLGEYIFDTCAAQSRVRYSMVRFTHILDNSLMNVELEQASQSAQIAIHSPGKYVTAQNVTEAVGLLLNALLHSERGRCNFLTVRNLAWPVESLEVALYYIKHSKNNIPVIFKGNPPGYAESFFRGQFDWSNPQELNLLINAYEYKVKAVNAEGDIFISHISPTSAETLYKALEFLKLVDSEEDARCCLFGALQSQVRESLKRVSKYTTLDILEWGLQLQTQESEINLSLSHVPMLNLLIESLEGADFSVHFQSRFDEIKRRLDYLMPRFNYAGVQ